MREASPTLTTTMDVLTQLKAFRQAAYDCLGKAHGATFELTDAVMSSAQRLLFGRLFPVSSISAQVVKYLRGITGLPTTTAEVNAIVHQANAH